MKTAANWAIFCGKNYLTGKTCEAIRAGKTNKK